MRLSCDGDEWKKAVHSPSLNNILDLHPNMRNQSIKVHLHQNVDFIDGLNDVIVEA